MKCLVMLCLLISPAIFAENDNEAAMIEAGFEVGGYEIGATHITLYRAAAEGVSRAIFIYSHGMTSRANQHRKLLTAVRKSGLDVVGYDLPGHGTSDRELGIKGNIRSADQLVEVLTGVIDAARARYGMEKPVVLSGWSLGGLLTTVYLQRYPERAHSAVLFTPGVSLSVLHVDPGMAVNFDAKLAGELFGVNTNKLVHDERLAAELRADEGYFDFPPPSLSLALFKLWKEGNPYRYRTPSLVFTAGGDVFSHAEGVKRFYGTAESQNRCAIVASHLANSFHDVANDIDSARVLKQTIDYLLRQFPG